MAKLGGGEIDLRHLRAFVAVAEELHFSRAAERLHLVQQSLSAQIRALEDDLGVQLFQRTTRKVELSPAGRVLLTHAQAILAAVNTACEQTRRATTGETGQLAIAYTPTVAAEALPRLVDEVHVRYPELHLQMCEMWQAESVAAVNAGRFDVGLARCPILVEDMESACLREEPMGIILGAAHSLASHPRVPLPFQMLLHSTLAIWPRALSPGFFDLVVGFFRSQGFVGTIHEFENLASGVFYSDARSRDEIAACKAFSVAFETQFDPVPPGFIWRAIEPCPRIPLDMFWRVPASPATGNFIRLAHDVAERQGWEPDGVQAKQRRGIPSL